MGDFAELNTRFKLKENTPMEIINTIKYMNGTGPKPDKIPDHPLFETERWESMLRTFSDDTKISGHFTYFEKHPRYTYWELCVRSVFRDRGEIRLSVW